MFDIRTTACACLLLTLGLTGRVLAQDTTPPPSVWVDVNNDGMWDPTVDIGPGGQQGIDIDQQIIQQLGVFDTQVSGHGYKAPATPASLVVEPGFVYGMGFPLNLRAGQDLKFYGNAYAPTITLRSGTTPPLPPPVTGQSTQDVHVLCHTAQGYGSVDVTGATLEYATKMTVTAGVDVILDGVLIQGDDPASTFNATAGHNISAVEAFDIPGWSPSITSGHSMTIDATGSFRAAFPKFTMWADTAGAMTLTADGPMTIEGGASILSLGKLTVKSVHDAVLIGDPSSYAGESLNALTAGSVAITSPSSVSLGQCDILADGAVTINAADVLDMCNGWPVSIIAGNLVAKGASSLNALSAYIQCSTGTASIASAAGYVCLDGAIVEAIGGISVTAHADITALTVPTDDPSNPAKATLTADHYVKFTATTGVADLAGSKIAPIDALITPTTYITAICCGTLTASDVQWACPAKITLKSTGDSVHIENSVFDSATAQVLAYGLDIWATGATTFTAPKPSFGPAGYRLHILP